jgi:Kef-type K+ transport system membrane component KefB
MAFLFLAAALAVALVRGQKSTALSAVLLKLQDTTAQIRIRGAALMLLVLVAVAQRFGLETILGAFVAGAILPLIDRDALQTHPHFRIKVEAIGYGIFVPIFFVTSGIKFNLSALLHSPAGLIQVPLYVLALLIIRGLPALIYRRIVGLRRAIAAGFYQATTLSFVVASVQIGAELHLIDDATGAALIAASLVSVLIFPLAAGIVLQE